MKMKYEFHPCSAVYGMLPADELEELAQSMREHGFLPQHAITLYEGQILDGRNRSLAAEIAGVEPVYQEYTGDNPLDFVAVSGSNRRDLTKSKRVAAALRYSGLEDLMEAAKERMSPGTNQWSVPKMAPTTNGKTREVHWAKLSPKSSFMRTN